MQAAVTTGKSVEEKKKKQRRKIAGFWEKCCPRWTFVNDKKQIARKGFSMTDEKRNRLHICL